MLKKLKAISKEKYWDYFILASRFLLAFTFFSYGFGKLTGGQFGVNQTILQTPLQDVSLFKIAWYLFDHQPFKAFIGVSQIVCALLLIVNRTVLLGAFLFLPIVTVILIIDLTIMPPMLANAFTWRLSYYIILNLLIIWHYKRQLKQIWQAIYPVKPHYNYALKWYVILPFAVLLIGFVWPLLRILTNLIMHPNQTIYQLKQLPTFINNIIDKLLI